MAPEKEDEWRQGQAGDAVHLRKGDGAAHAGDRPHRVASCATNRS